ncbi:MAG: hypothetical protein IKO03_03695 [Lachnospiraceae bacterium]|nr:hypothetical protein [Lachnospiraceae bacterium]MBR3507880.1 hypothetical protein [Lachnospiraceae bacterium]MBR4605752.1 hypothetical protein [Lachnospiraceae bacterium]
MRRTILAFCTAAIILACGILTPVTASAEEARGCAQHTMNGTHAGTMTRVMYTHPVFLGNGTYGPMYETCTVKGLYDEIYLRCTVCGYIDYDHPVSQVLLNSWHDYYMCPHYNE